MMVKNFVSKPDIKFDDARKKRIELGWWIYLVGEIAFFFIVLYALFK